LAGGYAALAELLDVAWPPVRDGQVRREQD